MSNKKDQRRKLKTLLSSISDFDLHQLSAAVSLNLKKLLDEHDVIQKNLVIGVFAPIKKEPDWSLMLEKEKLKTAYPAYVIDEAKMVFKLARMSELEKAMDFGVEILGPAPEAELVTPDILLVPGLGFTKDGKRLGRGKGFYDKFLQKSTAVKIGIAFEMQILETISTEAHDELMDFVVTDKCIYKKS